MDVTIDQLKDKLDELIDKHNNLAEIVMDLSNAINLINENLFANGPVPDKSKFDS